MKAGTPKRFTLQHLLERMDHMALNLDALKTAVDTLKKQIADSAAVAAADQAELDSYVVTIVTPVITPDAGGGIPPPPPPA